MKVNGLMKKLWKIDIKQSKNKRNTLRTIKFKKKNNKLFKNTIIMERIKINSSKIISIKKLNEFY